jgi:hypothetical protein
MLTYPYQMERAADETSRGRPASTGRRNDFMLDIVGSMRNVENHQAEEGRDMYEKKLR